MTCSRRTMLLSTRPLPGHSRGPIPFTALKPVWFSRRPWRLWLKSNASVPQTMGSMLAKKNGMATLVPAGKLYVRPAMSQENGSVATRWETVTGGERRATSRMYLRTSSSSSRSRESQTVRASIRRLPCWEPEVQSQVNMREPWTPAIRMMLDMSRASSLAVMLLYSGLTWPV